MRYIILMVCFLGLAVVTFILGKHWGVYQIKMDLQETGSSVAQYGDTARVKIVGTAQDIK